jgi:class I fructose-bisphosphate aldolase
VLNHGKLAGTGRMVILPVDQGFEHGPARSFATNPPAYDPRYHFELAIDSGCSAYPPRCWISLQQRLDSSVGGTLTR